MVCDLFVPLCAIGVATAKGTKKQGIHVVDVNRCVSQLFRNTMINKQVMWETKRNMVHTITSH